MGTTRSPGKPICRGKRYIAYARCAAADGAAAKLAEQIRRIRQFGDHFDMQCVDEVRLAGVSGWRPTLRDDLRRLMARKRQQGDFEVLVVEDFARLTRTGPAGGAMIETEFRKCGVTIVYVAEAAGTEGAMPSPGVAAFQRHRGKGVFR